MFIRVKRKKATYFLSCDPSETVLEVKAKLQVLSDNLVNRQRLILLSTQHVLDDAKTLADQRVENDAVLAFTLQKENGEWEDVDIENPNEHQNHIDSESS